MDFAWQTNRIVPPWAIRGLSAFVSRATAPVPLPREIMSFFLNRAMTMQGIVIQIERLEMEESLLPPSIRDC